MVSNEGKPLLPDLLYHEMESSHIGYFPGMGRQVGNNKNARNWNASCQAQKLFARCSIQDRFSLVLECLRVAILRVAVSMWTCHVKGESFSPTH